MSAVFDAIIVGGGIAGLTSAAYLCRHGHRTLLCEKASKTGGLVNTFRHQGYAFDGGIRAFENSGILLPMLKNLNLPLSFLPNPVSIGIADKWTNLSGEGSLSRYADMLKFIFPSNHKDIDDITQEIQRVMGYMHVIYGIDNPLFLDNMKDPKVLKTLLPWLLRYHVNIRKASRLSQPVNAYLRTLTDNQALVDMITQHFFHNTPTYFALSYFGLYLDYRYLTGGTGQLAEALTDYVLRAGGEVVTDTDITRADTKEKRVYTASGDCYGYRQLVWAADQSALYRAASPSTPGAERHKAMMAGARGNDSVLSLFMGVAVDQAYFAGKSGPHAFYTPSTLGLSTLEDWRTQAAQADLDAWIARYLERTTYEISCPSLRDATLAPEGKTSVIVSTLMDYDLTRHLADSGQYDYFKQLCTNKIIQVLETSAFPGISAQIDFTLCATPLTMERETGNAQGAITGWAFDAGTMPAQSEFTKMAKAIQTPFAGIHQCGQWTFSPSGLPVSILTGKLAADAAHRELGSSTAKGR